MQANTQEAQNYRTRFRDYYFKNIKPQLENYEELRLKSKQKVFNMKCTCVILALAVVALISSVFIIQDENFVFPFFGVATVLGVILAYLIRDVFDAKKAFENKVKEDILKIFLRFFGEFSWNPRWTTIDERILKVSKIIGAYNCKTTDDDFKGTYKGLNISISEFKLENIDSDGRTMPVFKGIAIQIDMNKKFNTQTIIFQNKFLAKATADILGNGIKKITLEDVDFNDLYEVYSYDEVEARYLLTTSFMERFKALQDTYKTSDIKACFLNNKLTILIPSNRDKFNLANIDTPVTDSGQITQFFEEFTAVLSLVDLLHLDSKTGL